jgi:hypothetical protein
MLCLDFVSFITGPMWFQRVRDSTGDSIHFPAHGGFILPNNFGKYRL